MQEFSMALEYEEIDWMIRHINVSACFLFVLSIHIEHFGLLHTNEEFISDNLSH